MSSVCRPRLVACWLREFPPCSVVCGLLLSQHTHTIHAVVVAEWMCGCANVILNAFAHSSCRWFLTCDAYFLWNCRVICSWRVRDMPFLTYDREINNLIPSFLHFNRYAICWVYKLTYFDDFYILSIKELRSAVKGQNRGVMWEYTACLKILVTNTVPVFDGNEKKFFFYIKYRLMGKCRYSSIYS
jgi:hypothetical protein